ncbi:MAG: hypothetical protein OHK0031_00040 [Anaerolineales bacterium]
MSPQKKTNFLFRLWLSFTQPHASVSDPAERSYAQLVASLTLALALLFPGSYLAAGNLPGFNTPQDATRSFLLIGVITAYFLARTPFYRSAAYLIVGLMTSLSYVFLLVEPALSEGDILIAMVTFIPITIGLAASLLPPTAIFIITVLNGVAVNLIPLMQPLLSQRLAGAFSGGIISLGVLLTIVIAYRNSAEREVIGQLESINARLETAQSDLEQRVEERTAELNRRSAQLEAAAQVARSSAEVRDMQELLENVVRQITERFDFYHAGIFLTEPGSSYVTLQAASSEGGRRMMARGHRLEIGRQGIVGYAAYQKSPRIAQNVGADSVFFNNPDLPNTRSEIALPLEVRDQLIGVLDIQSETEHAFSNEDVNTLKAMADQIALAIENARLIQESQAAMSQLQRINAESVAAAWREKMNSAPGVYMYTPTGVSALTRQEAQAAKQEESGHLLRVPLLLRGKKIGAILLRRKANEKPWGQAEEEMAAKISAQVALAVENARLLEETQRRALREQTLNELSGRFSRSLDVDTLLQNAARDLQRLPQVAAVSVVVAPDEPETPSQPKA